MYVSCMFFFSSFCSLLKISSSSSLGNTGHMLDDLSFHTLIGMSGLLCQVIGTETRDSNFMYEVLRLMVGPVSRIQDLNWGRWN